MSGESNFQEEIKDIISPAISKFDGELYHEEDDIALPIIRVKSFSLPNNGIKWKLFSDNKVIYTIDGKRLNKKEKNFLKTIDGVNFLLNEAKKGIISFNL